jgi:hypothetical protein
MGIAVLEEFDRRSLRATQPMEFAGLFGGHLVLRDAGRNLQSPRHSRRRGQTHDISGGVAGTIRSSRDDIGDCEARDRMRSSVLWTPGRWKTSLQ